MSDDPHRNKEIDQVTGVETTGLEWDGLKELNNPLPRWWLTVLFVCIVFAVGYWFFFPAWPTLAGHTGGMLQWSEYGQLKQHQGEIAALRSKYEARFAQASLEDIQKDQELYDYGRAGGAIAFKNNCAACHGAGAQGGAGYPNLNDDDWIWGGSLQQIFTTIRYGAHDPSSSETHQSQMAAWGADGLLKPEEIDEVAEYAQKLHEGDKAQKTPAWEKGKEIFAANCAACHGASGEGNQELGAPRLSDNIWLYGGDLKSIKATIYGGRAGLMPAWGGKLDESTLKKLAVYAHSLGGGK